MRTHVALVRGIPTCDNAPVPTPEYDPAIEAAALDEVAALAAELEAAEAVAEEKRKALHDAIVRHLSERNAPPGKIATSAKYDRNHVGRIARAAGVEPLRESTVRPAARRARKKAS
jgi:hypothetical protein